MENREEKLKKTVGTETGFRVPEGYFEEVFATVDKNLPPMPRRQAPAPSRWQRIKPYVYLAAMFAGIWCMMKMFHSMTTEERIDLDNPPALFAEAVADNHIYDMNEDHGFTTTASGFELEEEVVGSYTDMDELIEDFDYDFEPEHK